MSRRALVLGSGENAAIAWEIGIIVSRADAGIDSRWADLFVGTSAGSVVAAQTTSGLSLEDLFQLQVDPRLQVDEALPSVDFGRWRAELVRAEEAGERPSDFLRRVGSVTAVVPTTKFDRRNLIARRLPTHTWPEQCELIVAADADSGELRVFERTDDVELVDAVAASCAVAGDCDQGASLHRRWVLFDRERDLAADAERVLIP